MPTLDFNELLEELATGKKKRRAADLTPEDVGGLATLTKPPPQGLLASIGRTLDFPRRKAWEMLGAGPESTGRELLEKVGLLGRNTPGFDVGDVAGFLAEVVGDPLTYLGGVGVATKAGKGAKALAATKSAFKGAQVAKRGAVKSGVAGDIATRTQAAREFAEDLLRQRRSLRAAGQAEKLAPGYAAQARAGQRQLLGFDVPFTGIAGKIRVPGEERVLAGLEKTLGKVRGSRPAQAVSRLFSTKAGVPEALDPLRELRGRDLRGSDLETMEYLAKGGKEIEDLAKQHGVSVEEAQRLVARGIETKPSGKLFPRGATVPIRRSVETSANILKAERAARIPQAELEGTLGYMRHLVSPTGREWGRAGGFKDPFVNQFLETSARTGAQIQRVPELAGKNLEEANLIMQQRGAPPGFFITDPVLATAFRQREGRRAIANANFTSAAIKQFGKPGGVGTPAAEIFAKVGMGVDPKLAGHVVPQEFSDAILKLTQRTGDPAQIDGFFKGLNAVRRAYASLLLPLFPAYLVRNLENNVGVSMFLAQVVDAGDYGTAMKLWKAALWNKDPAALSRLNDLRVKGVVGTSRMAHETTGETLQETLRSQVYRGPRPKGIARFAQPENIPGLGQAIKFGFKVNDTVESVSRIAHYLGARKRGMSDLDAVASVRKYLFDYDDLTDFERKYAKPTFLFYQFTRKMLPLLLKSAQEHPGRMALLTRTATQPTQQDRTAPLPEELRTSAAIPLGRNAQGDRRYLQGVGLPLEELNKFDPTSKEGGVLGGAGALARKLAQQLNPALRIPMELGFQKDLYTGRDIMQGDKAPTIARAPLLRNLLGTREEKLPGGGTRLAGDPLALYAMRALPTSRLGRTVGDVAGMVKPELAPQTGLAQKLLSTLTGLRFRNEDEEDQARAVLEALEAEGQAMRRTGEVGEFKTLYARGPKGEKNPQAVELAQRMQLIRDLLKTLREKRE